MTCQWDRSWSPTTQLGTCDWVACLRPPSPPASTNLRLTGWDGQPIPFGGSAEFVCERGYRWEEDSGQSVSVTCQGETTATTQKGFFAVPETEKAWPRCILAPVCPPPPEAPPEGIREHLPLGFPVENNEGCFLNGDLAQLSCHSFLNIYPTKLTYGRAAAAKKELCGGASPPDSKAAPLDCYEETINQEMLTTASDLCRGHFNCSLEVPTIILSPACDGLKREYKIEYLCGKTEILFQVVTSYHPVYCTDWGSYLSSKDCLDEALIENKWANSSHLTGLQKAEKVSLLVENLHYFLSAKLHPLEDLSGRKESGAKGSLCGLAALYRAGRDTLLSQSEIKLMSYDLLRERLGGEMGLEDTKALSDQALLEQFYEC